MNDAFVNYLIYTIPQKNRLSHIFLAYQTRHSRFHVTQHPLKPLDFRLNREADHQNPLDKHLFQELSQNYFSSFLVVLNYGELQHKVRHHLKQNFCRQNKNLNEKLDTLKHEFVYAH